MGGDLGRIRTSRMLAESALQLRLSLSPTPTPTPSRPNCCCFVRSFGTDSAGGVSSIGQSSGLTVAGQSAAIAVSERGAGAAGGRRAGAEDPGAVGGRGGAGGREGGGCGGARGQCERGHAQCWRGGFTWGSGWERWRSARGGGRGQRSTRAPPAAPPPLAPRPPPTPGTDRQQRVSSGLLSPLALQSIPPCIHRRRRGVAGARGGSGQDGACWGGGSTLTGVPSSSSTSCASLGGERQSPCQDGAAHHDEHPEPMSGPDSTGRGGRGATSVATARLRPGL
eukprot:1735913-Rhodomonas_salina.2